MTADAGQCATCGRARWAGERFCPTCGSEQSDVADGPALLDLDADVAETSGSAVGSNRRESLLGIAALGAIIAVVALLFTLGNNAAEDLTAPDEPTVEPTPTSPPTPRATPVPTMPIPTTPRPGTVLPTLTPVAGDRPLRELQLDELRNALIDLDLGEGWMVAVDDPRRPSAINLQTGEVVTVASPFLSPRTNVVLAAAEGLFLPTATGVVTTWSLVPWDGTEVRTAANFDNANTAFGREPGWFFNDEEVGPVVIHLLGTDQLRLHALALNTGESRQVPLDDPIPVFLTGGFFDFAGLRTATDSVILDNGGTIWRWTFNGGWSEVASGAVRLVTGSSAVTVACADPSECTAELINARTGELIAELPNYTLNADPIVWGQGSLISPDSSYIAQFSGLTNPTYDRPDISIYEVATGETRRIGRTDFNWWELIAWSPNSRYLIANGELGIAAIDVVTDEVQIISTHGVASGPTSSLQLALLPTIERSADG